MSLIHINPLLHNGNMLGVCLNQCDPSRLFSWFCNPKIVNCLDSRQKSLYACLLLIEDEVMQ